jgi:hypothetical protein
MGRSLIVLGILAVAGFLFLGPPQGQAAEDYQQTSYASDPDVIGMDHSKLNHGVLGAARTNVGSEENAIKAVLDTDPPASKNQPLPGWAPPAEIADKVAAAAREGAIKAVLDTDPPASKNQPLAGWAPPAEIADKVAAAAREDAIKAVQNQPLSGWAPPAEIADKVAAAARRTTGQASLRNL